MSQKRRGSAESGAGQRAGSGHAPLFPDSAAILRSGDAWRNLDVQRLRLSLETPEHDHADHFLTLHLGPPGVIECREGARHLRFPVTPGDITLTGANVAHQVRYEGVDQLSLSLPADFVVGVASELWDSASVAEAVEFPSQYGVRDPQVERIGQLLRAELEAGCPSGPLFGDGLAQALAAHLLRQYSSLPTTREVAVRDGLSPVRLRRVADFLEANLNRDVSLTEMADAAGLSPYHFARQFKSATGLSPHAYLIARRVERAKELLARSDLPLSEVATATGFAHQSHLTRHFRRTVGATPARFRAQVR